jgi:hypothetical protein
MNTRRKKYNLKKLELTQHQIVMRAVRNSQKEQGIFDGRYRTKTIVPKNKFTRKIKHKNNQN